MVLLYTRDTNDIVNDVIDFLDIEFIRIGEIEISLIEEMSFNKTDQNVNVSNNFINSVNLNNIDFIWFYGGGVNSGGSNYENECYSILLETFLNLTKVQKLGRPIEKYDFSKLNLHLEAKNQGFIVPDTLITGNKEKLLSFYNNHRINGIICKRILDDPFYSDQNYLYDFTLTFPINQEDFHKIPNVFGISLFQERIISDFEIRVVFVKDRFYSMAIHTQGKEIDYRPKLVSNKNIRLIPFTLPSNIQTKLRKLFGKAKLNFGSTDLLYANGKYYFLEINPIGQIGFLNNNCNFYIEKYIAKLIKNEK